MIDVSKITDIVSEKSGVAKQQIIESAHLSGDLNLSPMEIVDLIAFIAKEYHLQLSQDFDVKSIQTVSDIYQLVEQEGSEI